MKENWKVLDVSALTKSIPLKFKHYLKKGEDEFLARYIITIYALDNRVFIVNWKFSLEYVTERILEKLLQS